jgi:hypothetical protein
LRAVDKAGFLRADSIIYAAGGMLRSAGLPQGVMAALSATDLKPVLGPLRTDTQFLHKLDGIRAQVRLSCPGAQFSEEGEVLFRSYGISGIVVFNASRFVNPGEAVVLDFAPRYSHDQVVTCLLKRAKQFAARTGKQPTYADLLKGIFLAELASALISFTASGGEPIASCTPVNSAGINALAYAIKNFELHVTGVGSLDQCQVCRGGIAVSEVDAQTLEAHQIPGLFITGEALDVDAPCGGYNLHWAWATGLLAGRAAANKLAACQVALDQQASLRKAKNHLLVRCSIKKEGYKP